MRPIKIDEELLNKRTEEFRAWLQEKKNLTDLSYSLTMKETLPTEERIELLYTTDAYSKQQALIKDCNNEVGWHGLVTKLDDKHYLIDDILVFPQIVTGTSVLPDEVAYTEWLMQYMMDDTSDTFDRMKYHGHSHVDMAVFASGVDTAYQNDMLEKLEDFYIFSINNKKGDRFIVIYDVINNIVYENADIVIKLILPSGEKVSDWTTKELEKVTTPLQSVTGKFPPNKTDTETKVVQIKLGDTLFDVSYNLDGTRSYKPAKEATNAKSK